jgi:mRNA interferase MazF
MTDAPRRWHLYVVDLGSRVGTKPGKHRPCLAIQPDAFREGGLRSTVILPLTTQLLPPESWPLRVRAPAGTCGLARDSDVMVDQILAWDHASFRDDLGEIPEALQDTVKRALAEFLDLGGAE